MKKPNVEIDTVRLNLVLSKEFYGLLKQNANNEYLRIGTWTKTFLMKNLLAGDNKLEKCITENERN